MVASIALSLTWLVGLAALSGCHNRAYNDLYVENMAAEIRDLEDQLYEYDYQTRLLEQELSSLRQQNAKLKPADPGATQGKQYQLPNPPLEFQPRGSQSTNPESDLTPPNQRSEPKSILENEQDPGLRPPFGSDELPAPRGNKDAGEFDSELLMPPTIVPGEPMPPGLPAVTLREGAQPNSNENDFELNLSRIEVPGMLASQATRSPASIQVATEKVTDTRVVELAFHSSLSRAVNFDDRSDDDGLYLVLQPKNESGQMVPAAADLSVVVLDPAREGNAARIGRWDYSAAEVKDKMLPIGSNQGIHLTLPWNGPDPSADRVIVFVRYTFDNGRQVIGQKEIFVSSDGGLKTVWAPRGTSEPVHAGIDQVAPAAYQAIRPPNNVVRPASGETSNEPAPPPNR